jgi:serine/threonine protein kinase
MWGPVGGRPPRCNRLNDRGCKISGACRYIHQPVSSPAQDLASPGVGGVAGFEPPEEFDDFVVLRRLGQGATGQVYLAEDSVLARPVAIEFLGADPDPAAASGS